MAFHSQGRFTGPHFDTRNENIRYRAPLVPGQMIMGPQGRQEQFDNERFPPPPRSFHGRFPGSRWPRQGFEQTIGGPRGRDFPPRDYISRPRFDRFKRVKEEHLSIPVGKEGEPVEKSVAEKSIKFGSSSDTSSLNDKKKSNEAKIPIMKQEEGSLHVKLDDYNCDLHFNSDESGTIGWTLHKDGFESLWGGCRATHGVKRGKVAFEVTILEALSVQVPETERNPHVLRVGWSVDGADLQLGEDHLSYGYGGTGKVSVNSKFTNYGRPFFVGDILTCCLDLDVKPSSIFYLLNGEYLGIAFTVGNELGGKALYPHVTVKNMKFQVNFGGQWPKHPITPGFAMLQNVPYQDLCRAQEGPNNPQEAEVIMMIGLPSSGKTFWAEKYCKENPDKRFYMLGTNNIIDKMRIFGLTRKRNYHGRWDALIKQATGCLNTWLKIAEKRVRNYIIDQTNVYFTARRRKMNSFRGYKRTAIVVINEPSVLADRSGRVQREEGKIVPVSAVMEMKANFSLPEVGESFDEVRYVEVMPPRAIELVKAFVDEGQVFKKGAGASHNRNEPRFKMPRVDSQGGYGGSTDSMGGEKKGDPFDRTRNPSGVEGLKFEPSGSSHVNSFNTRERSYERRRDTEWPNRVTQDRIYRNWDEQQMDSYRRYNDRMPLPNDNPIYDRKLKCESLDIMQGHGGYNNREIYHGNWKADNQSDRKTENWNYSMTDVYNRDPVDTFVGDSNVNFNSRGGQHYSPSTSDFMPYNHQADINFQSSSKHISQDEQASSGYRYDNRQLGQNYRMQSRTELVPSNSNDTNFSSITRPKQQMDYGIRDDNYRREQRKHDFMGQSDLQQQGYSKQEYPIEHSSLYQRGISYQEITAESGGQGFDVGWAVTHPGQQAAYTSTQSMAQRQHQQQRPSSYF